jgi:pimeloyl-ACP methyl ester carboxylesterase
MSPKGSAATTNCELTGRQVSCDKCQPLATCKPQRNEVLVSASRLNPASKKDGRVSARIRCTPQNFISSNGVTLCWDSFGDPDHPPLILIAGMASQMIAWDDEFCEQLAARRFHVIRFDNRDVGQSTWLDSAGMPDTLRAMTRAWLRQPVEAPYRLEDMASDVTGLMDALGIRQAHVVGASMGATIAQTMAIRHPERMLSMTSIMSTTGDPDLPRANSAALAAVMRPMPLTLERYVEQYVDTWKTLRVGRFPEEEARDRTRAVRNHGRGLNPSGAARHLVAILASGTRKEALRAVSVPTAVIHGALDPLVPLAAGRQTAETIPGAELFVLKEMGHAMPLPLWPEIIERIVSATRRAP